MRLPPFASQNRFYRGNLHGHSTHSDGLLSPDKVVQRYSDLGYDFTCLSDHLWIDERFSNTRVFDGSYLNRDSFITIRSAELHCYGKRFDQDGIWHILANGLPVDFACPNKEEKAPELIKRACSAGAYVTLAHPEWYALTNDEALQLSEADAVEIYNHSCVLSSARGSGIAIADYLINEGHRINFTAADDSHFDLPDFGGGWVMVASPELTEEAIIGALKSGDYYSSTGAEIKDLCLQNNILKVISSPVDSIVISGAGHFAMARHDKNLTVAEFDLQKIKSTWFRVTIKSSNAGMAWTNPLYFCDIK